MCSSLRPPACVLPPELRGCFVSVWTLLFHQWRGGGGLCWVHLCSGLEGQGGFSPRALPSTATQRKAAPLLLTKIVQVIKGGCQWFTQQTPIECISARFVEDEENIVLSLCGTHCPVHGGVCRETAMLTRRARTTSWCSV